MVVDLRRSSTGIPFQSKGGGSKKRNLQEEKGESGLVPRLNLSFFQATVSSSSSGRAGGGLEGTLTAGNREEGEAG